MKDDLKVSQFNNRRFVIYNSSGEIIDDEGYGYKTKQGAYRALSYK